MITTVPVKQGMALLSDEQRLYEVLLDDHLEELWAVFEPEANCHNLWLNFLNTEFETIDAHRVHELSKRFASVNAYTCVRICKLLLLMFIHVRSEPNDDADSLSTRSPSTTCCAFARRSETCTPSSLAVKRGCMLAQLIAEIGLFRLALSADKRR